MSSWSATSPLRQRSVCEHLLGKKYEYGSNGAKVDCIALVIQALDCMGMTNPGLKAEWYEMSLATICRELNRYTDRIKEPSYYGDIVLLSGDPIAFGVTWQGGILYINRLAMAVDWKPIKILAIRRSYRMKSS